TRPHIKADFSTWQAHGKIEVALGRRANGCALSRTLNLYIASGYVPLPRTSEWREQFAGQVIDPPAKCPSGN
ncbi:MAG: glycosyltransferase family 39 protein, partial [Henriciella sp.]